MGCGYRLTEHRNPAQQKAADVGRNYMSTTFKTFPTKTVDITFGQVIKISEQHLNNFLNGIGLTKTIKLMVNIHDNDGKYVKDIQSSDKFEWKSDEYAWFTIEGTSGGTDAYCQQVNGSDIDPEHPWWKLELLKENNIKIQNIEEKFERSKLLNRYWWFRRSAGQPGIIALTYGLISASVAELSDGILWSDDGGWDIQQFPANSEDFFSWYFRPDKATKKYDAEWARECIDSIREELM